MEEIEAAIVAGRETASCRRTTDLRLGGMAKILAIVLWYVMAEYAADN